MDQQPGENNLRRKIDEISGGALEREILKKAMLSADAYKNNANECTSLWLGN
jgi:hypothetical protein